jgi:hypothetical protein
MFAVRNDWFRPIALVVAIVMVIPAGLVAQTIHVASPADLQKQVMAARQTRQKNVDKVRNFLSTPVAEQAMQKSHVDSGKVKAAVASLGDEELAQLAARADKAQQDFAAGYLSTRDIALIVLAVVVIILIIVIA